MVPSSSWIPIVMLRRYGFLVSSLFILALMATGYFPLDSFLSPGSAVELGSRENPSDVQHAEVKRILYWTTYWQFDDFELGFGTEPFIRLGCKVTNCWATKDRSWLNRSDAILFHAYDYDQYDLPDPAGRLPHQRYVFHNHEGLPGTPDKTSYDVFALSAPHFFNWTMTQRRDSDILSHHGSLLLTESSHDYPVSLPPGKPLPLGSPHPDPVAVKKKMMVWFVSNCNTTGRRERYMRELSKFIPVDFYGTCGFGKNQLVCKPNAYVTDRDGCFKRILPRYKFVFAAENNICPDYISEQLYRPLRLGSVPVVYGGADYSDFAPRGSYIDVADFPSPKDLADYLLLLDRNDALYSLYFEWKRHWRVIEHHPKAGFCELCERLNNPAEPAKSYANFSKWWFEGAPCFITGPPPFMSGNIKTMST